MNRVRGTGVRGTVTDFYSTKSKASLNPAKKPSDDKQQDFNFNAQVYPSVVFPGEHLS